MVPLRHRVLGIVHTTGTLEPFRAIYLEGGHGPPPDEVNRAAFMVEHASFTRRVYDKTPVSMGCVDLHFVSDLVVTASCHTHTCAYFVHCISAVWILNVQLVIQATPCTNKRITLNSGWVYALHMSLELAI
jgi:hypothetical protein